MSLIRTADSDYRFCLIDFETLEAIQSRAEEEGWTTRWSSLDALRGQVGAGPVILQTFLRQDHGKYGRAVRCFALFRLVGQPSRGAITTIDVEPATLLSVARLDRDPDVREALSTIFVLLLAGGIELIGKD